MDCPPNKNKWLFRTFSVSAMQGAFGEEVRGCRWETNRHYEKWVIHPEGTTALRWLRIMNAKLCVLLMYYYFFTFYSNFPLTLVLVLTCQTSHFFLCFIEEFCLHNILVCLSEIIKFQAIKFRFNHPYISCLDTSFLSVKKKLWKSWNCTHSKWNRKGAARELLPSMLRSKGFCKSSQCQALK